MSRSMIAIACAILIVASSPPVAGMLIQSLERQYQTRPVGEYKKARVIVILGGSINMPLKNRYEIELTESSDRVLQGFRLYRAEKGDLIFLSGGNVDTKKWRETEASLVSELLQEWGVPADVIEIEERSKTTYENALYTQQYLERKGWLDESILLVTSASHMPRSVAVFKAAGVNVIPAPTDITIVDTRSDGLFSWLPSIGALGSTTRALHEYVGLWVYRLKGWV